ncbi:MAG: hypothetical protein U1F43_36930 [Myxococcota bacterium]
MRFVVPCEETETISLDHARQILEDVDIRSSAPSPITPTPTARPTRRCRTTNDLGAGAPDAGKVALRAQLRDLGANYGVPVWMVEVSHSDLPFDDFGKHYRGRAIRIDELVTADAAAFFGMNAMWDTVTHAGHYAGRDDPGFWSETDTVVLIDVENQKVVISPMGRAIAHYARWVAKGDLRVDATSGDPLVLVTAFVDPARTRLTVVAINNAATDRPLDLSAPSVTLAGSVTGELSTAAAPGCRSAASAPWPGTSLLRCRRTRS